MPRHLKVSDALLSLRGRMSITDEAEHELYEAKGEFALIFPTWRLKKKGREVASVNRVFFALRPTWEVECQFGNFRIVKQLLSFTDDYDVAGGPFDGAEVSGRLIRRDFSITHRGRLIASAEGSLISLRDRYDVMVVDDDDQSELFTAITMVAHHMYNSSSGSVFNFVWDLWE